MVEYTSCTIIEGVLNPKHYLDIIIGSADPWILKKFHMLNLDANGNAVWVTSDGERYNYCLLYEGNEHLLHK